MASDHKDGKHEHYIIPDSIVAKVGAALFVLTVVTVAVAQIDLGKFNTLVAVAVASVKALLVALFFMGLLYDKRENAVIFGSSLLFLAIFFVLTSIDIFFRVDKYTNKNSAAEALAFPGAPTGGGSKLKKPWISTPDLVAQGKSLFAAQCTACHGAEGQGNGPAAAGLNPKPRNFHQNEGWKNGRRVAAVFKTLSQGVGGMPSYASLSIDERWALTHYVIQFQNQAPAPDSAADYAAIGVDPSKETMGGAAPSEKSIPIEFAIERLTESK